jgi:iron complex outermembrane recepter protein
MKLNRVKLSLFAATALGATWTVPALAQSEEPAAETAEDTADKEDIVVVGSFIRGTEVTGSQTLSVSSDAITDKGAVSTNELLSLVPQIANTFNGRFEVDPRGVSTGLSINRPNLRNLPSANSASGGTALVLVDGFRVAPVGVNQSAVDVDIIPAAVLAGIDVITDGGSSLYGADAVSGVINFRTMRKFDGLKADFNYGLGDTISGYKYWDAALTGGLSWSSGNAWISGSYSKRNSVLNNETSWSQSQVFNLAGVGSFTGTQCDTPQATETRWFRFGPGATQFTNNPLAPGAGTFSLGSGCDAIGPATYAPEVKRYNVYGAVTQEFSDSIDLRVTGYWAKRDTSLPIVPRGFTSAGSGITNAAALTAAFPAALATAPGSRFAVTEGIGFRFAPNAAYVNVPNTVGIETWGITPELTFKFGSDWQLRATAHYGQSDNYQQFPSTNTTLAQCYITGCAASGTTPAISAGQLNPLNVAAASAAVITDITDFGAAQQTKQNMFVTRLVADGPLFQLPGGDAKIAVGLEYQRTKAESRLNTGRLGSVNALPYDSYSRNSKSAFAELSLPVMEWLDLSASLRIDDYSDFGSTTNPSLGASLKPTDWLRIYGHWSTSFNAPTAVDGLGIATGRFALNQYVAGSPNPAQRPSDPAPVNDLGFGTHAMVLDGTNSGTKPQTSENWAVGFEFTPIDGLNIGAQYYSLQFDDILAAVDPQNLTTYTTNPELYIYNTGPGTFPAIYAAILAQLRNGTQLGAQQTSNNIALIVDRRTSNIGTALLKGIDFHANYARDVAFGQISMGISGTKATKSVTNFGTRVNQLGVNGPELTASTFFGLKSGGFSSRATINYSGKYRDPNGTNTGVIGRVVNPFTQVNFAFGYEIEEGGILGGTSFRLGIDNAFEATPQIIRRSSQNFIGYAGYTLGRVFKFGISKKF